MYGLLKEVVLAILVRISLIQHLQSKDADSQQHTESN